MTGQEQDPRHRGKEAQKGDKQYSTFGKREVMTFTKKTYFTNR